MTDTSSHDQLTTLNGHAIARVTPSVAIAVSANLRRVARKAARPNSVVSGGGGFAARSGARNFKRGIIVSIVLFLVAPLLSASAYFGLIAADQYASEIRFVVRNGEQSPLDSMASVTGLPQGGRYQDSLIVSNYIRSRAMVESLERSPGLRRIYSSPHADFATRLDVDDPIEDVIKYWSRRVDIDVDGASGIVTVVVRAFTPEDSLALAEAIERNSEEMINQTMDRTRADALDLAGKRLSRAEQQLRSSVEQLKTVRNAEGMIDPIATAAGFTKVVVALRKELARVEENYKVQSSTVTDSAPQMRVLLLRISALKEQINKYESEMAGATGNDRSLSDAIGKFDQAKLRSAFAEQQYLSQSVAFETARADIATRQVYLSSILKPTLPEKALYPKRWFWWSAIIGASALVWLVVIGLAFTVRDHLAG